MRLRICYKRAQNIEKNENTNNQAVIFEEQGTTGNILDCTT